MIMLDIFNCIIEIVLIFLTIAIFHPINRYKKLKTKEEQLFVQKTLISILFFIFILIINIMVILTIVSENDYLYKIELFSFNIYIIIISFYNLFISLELYSTYTNPVYFFNRLLKQQRYNYIKELIILIIAIITGLLFLADFEMTNDNIRYKNNDDNDKEYFCNYSSIFILLGYWKPFFLIIISIISIVIYSRIKKKIQTFSFKYQDKLLEIIKKRCLGNILYIIYGVFYALPILSGTQLIETYHAFGSLFFSLIIFNDFIIHIAIIAPSKFCEYRLNKTFLGYFCSCFIKIPEHSNSSSRAPLISTYSLSETIGMGTTQNYTNTAFEIISNNTTDKELVSTFKNGLFLEDYFLGYFDQILNIITCSMFEIYNSKYFSSQANEKNLSSSIKIEDISSITGTMQNLTVSNLGNKNKSNLSSKNEIGDEIVDFTMKKNYEKDEFLRFKDVLESGIKINNFNNYLDISIKSFFTPRCVESIYNQKLKGKIIANSFLSHMILTNNAKNKKFDNPNSYFWSLLATNAREDYFNKLKNTSLKTFDKNFTIDIFDTDDGDITINNKGINNQLAILLDKYFTYISAKGIKGTFIPSLVGVFKIKINYFKTLLIFITRNPLVENVPKNDFTYWQLIRFLNDKPQKIASSKLINDSLVKDDPIFERSFQIETKKENPNYNKIFVKNFFDFKETIKNDLLFLKGIGAQNFNLLLMYYEYENTKKHETQGIIKIKETKEGAEFIEESMPKDLIFDEENIANNKSGSKSPESFDGKILNMSGEFLDEDFGIKKSGNKKKGNLIDIEEKVSINGYEGIFDSFNCLCFFTFENVFDIRKRLSLAINYYDNFQNKVLNNFCGSTK